MADPQAKEIDFSQPPPTAIDFSQPPPAATGLGMYGRSLTNSGSVPNARLRNLPNPAAGETSDIGALYHGAKMGATLASIPAAASMTIPSAARMLVGGTVGAIAGKKGAEALGAGELGQEVGGDVGGLLGAGLTEGAYSAAKSRVQSAWNVLPKAVQQEIKSQGTGMLSPRAKHFMDFVNSVKTEYAAKEPPAVYPGAPNPETPPQEVLQASALMRGGQPAVDPAAGLGQIPVAKAPGQAGSMVESVTAPKPEVKPAQVQAAAEDALGVKKLQPDVPLKNQKDVIPAKPSTLPEGHTPAGKSSWVGSYKYDPETREFQAMTKTGGKIYVYGDVSPEEAAAFESADSKGKAMQKIMDNPHVANIDPQTGKRIAVKPARTITVDPNTGKPEFSDLAAQGQKSLDAMTIKHPEYGEVPRFMYRARDVGETGVPLKQSHAQAGSNLDQITKYAEPGQRSVEGGEVVKIDLKKLKPTDYVVKSHPDGSKWVQFKRPLGEGEVSVVSTQSTSTK